MRLMSWRGLERAILVLSALRVASLELPVVHVSMRRHGTLVCCTAAVLWRLSNQG